MCICFMLYYDLINKPNINSEISANAVVATLIRPSLVLVTNTLAYSPISFRSLAAKIKQ
jgi:hypothetical protein